MHFITLAEAAALTARYRENRETILKETYQGLNVLPFCETFDRSAFDALLARPDCARIRVYYGMDEANQVRAVIVGADSEDQDILPAASLTEEDEDEDTGIIDRSFRCPDLCPPASPLNSDPA